MAEAGHRARDPERTIPARVRREVIERDGMVCQRCSRTVVKPTRAEGYRPDALHLDHIEYWASGGPNEAANLIVCCADCNLRRARPTNVIRNAIIGVEYRNGTHYWSRDDFQPPKRINSSHVIRSVKFTSDFLNAPIGQVLSLILSGSFGASGGRGAIQVGIPRNLYGPLSRYEAKIDRERQREDDRVARKARTEEENLAAKRKATRDSLDPARVDHWRQVVEEGRARRKAEREARGR